MNEIKERELDRLNKKITHQKRYIVVTEKMGEFGNELERKGYPEITDFMKMNDLMMELNEALFEMYKDVDNENRDLISANRIQANALRLYSEKFGEHILCPKDYKEFNFITSVSINPIDNDMLEVNVKITIIDEEGNDVN